MKINYKVVELQLKTTWKISRNASDTKKNLILELNGKRSEIAPNIRYGESIDTAIDEIEKFNLLNIELPKEMSEIREIMRNVSGHHSTKFGIESLLIKQLNKPISDLLVIAPPNKVMTSFSLPIMEVGLIKEYLQQNSGYQSYKIKVDRESAIENVKLVQSITRKKLRIDANEGFSSCDEVMHFLSSIKTHQIEFLEQPLASSNIVEQEKLFKVCPVEIIADESVEDNANFNLLKNRFHGINVKLMKAAGLLNAVRLLKEAKSNGMKTMLGCMIETSLGISYAMEINSLADYIDLDGHLLIKNDPFDLINLENGYLILK